MKVLQIIGTLNSGGAETLLLNILNNIDREKYKMDFLVFENKEYVLEKEFKKLGARIICIESPNKIGMLNFIKQLKKLCVNEKYDVVHAHTLFNCGPCMYAAYKAGIKTRIAHSHNTKILDEHYNFKKKIYFFIAKLLLNHFSTTRLACSEEAGKFLFYKNKEFVVIKNGIDINKFIFDNEINIKIRKKLNIPLDAFVIGNIGRMTFVKNQKFLIETFEKLHKEFKNSYLIIIGDGKLKGEISNEIKRINLEKFIFLTGSINNANEYYNVFNLFAMPSLYEGLPLVLVEAQTNGLPIIASNKINNESNITNRITFIPIDSSETWKDEILKEKNKERYNEINKIIENGFSIKNTVKEIEKVYNGK